MNKNRPADPLPILWIIDSERATMQNVAAELAGDLQCDYFTDPQDVLDRNDPPDLFLVSAEIPGGAGGQTFAQLIDYAGNCPVIVAGMLRSFAQAVAFFRAGAGDYLSLPIDREELLERFDAALQRAEKSAMRGLVMELEPIDADVGDITLSIAATGENPQPGPAQPSAAPHQPDADDDILAQLPGGKTAAEATTSAQASEPTPPSKPIPPSEPAPTLEPAPPSKPTSPSKPDREADAPDETGEGDEPEPVDGLPIPSLWEELPCGLLVFDSAGNMVFANRLGLELFGYESVAELQEVLENHTSRFAAHAANLRPLPDNQWPQVLARKSRMARSAVISIEKPDRRRSWIRIDCLPHLHDGKITRLSMTIVNLTGELPPFNPRAETTGATAGKPTSGKKDKRGRKKR